jgi:hypothetical protein
MIATLTRARDQRRFQRAVRDENGGGAGILRGLNCRRKWDRNEGIKSLGANKNELTGFFHDGLV